MEGLAFGSAEEPKNSELKTQNLLSSLFSVLNARLSEPRRARPEQRDPKPDGAGEVGRRSDQCDSNEVSGTSVRIVADARRRRA
jgi:hypothetical protein